MEKRQVLFSVSVNGKMHRFIKECSIYAAIMGTEDALEEFKRQGCKAATVLRTMDDNEIIFIDQTK